MVSCCAVVLWCTVRGAFVHLADIAYGPQSVSGPPGVTYLSGVPCRYVFQNEIDQEQFPFTLSTAWLTLDAVEPNGPWVLTPARGFTWENYWASDRVTVNATGTVSWVVCRVEFVEPFGRDPYWRCLLIDSALLESPPWPPPDILPPPVPPPLPPPPPPSPPVGGSCDDAPIIDLGDVYISPGDFTGSGWVKVACPAGTYYLHVSAYTASGFNTGRVYRGDECAHADIQGSFSSAPSCSSYTTVADGYLFIELFTTGTCTAFEFVIDEIPC